MGRCDKSRNQHIRKHYEATGHPLILSLHSREAWIWCYDDEALLDLDSPQLEDVHGQLLADRLPVYKE